MSFFACPHCGKETRIFSAGGSKHETRHEHSGGVIAACNRLGIEFLGDIPLDARVCADADRGVPTVVAEEADDRSARRNAFINIAKKITRKVGLEWR